MMQNESSRFCIVRVGAVTLRQEARKGNSERDQASVLELQVTLSENKNILK